MFNGYWVHPVHFPVFKTLFTAIRLLTKTKICLIVHNCLPHEHLPGAVFMSRSVLRMAHRLVVHSEAETQQAKRIGLAANDLVTAFHPLYDQFVLPAEPTDSIRRSLGLRKRVLLFFGFIRPYKGLECLLDAFCNLASRYPDVSLLVVGEHFNPKKGDGRGKDRLLSHLPPDDPVRRQIVWIDQLRRKRGGWALLCRCRCSGGALSVRNTIRADPGGLRLGQTCHRQRFAGLS